jgi:hypothetical protein
MKPVVEYSHHGTNPPLKSTASLEKRVGARAAKPFAKSSLVANCAGKPRALIVVKHRLATMNFPLTATVLLGYIVRG